MATPPAIMDEFYTILQSSFLLLKDKDKDAVVFPVSGKPLNKHYLGADFLGRLSRSIGVLYATDNFTNTESTLLYLEINSDKSRSLKTNLTKLRNYIKKNLVNSGYSGLVVVVGGSSREAKPYALGKVLSQIETVLGHEVFSAHGYFKDARFPLDKDEGLDKFYAHHIITAAPIPVKFAKTDNTNLSIAFDDTTSSDDILDEPIENPDPITALKENVQTIKEKPTEVELVEEEPEKELSSVENFNTNILQKLAEENFDDFKIVSLALSDGRISKTSEVSKINYLSIPVILDDTKEKRLVLFSDCVEYDFFDIGSKNKSITVSFNNGKTFLDMVEDVEPFRVASLDLLQGSLLEKAWVYLDRFFEDNIDFVPSELKPILDEQNIKIQVLDILAANG